MMDTRNDFLFECYGVHRDVLPARLAAGNGALAVGDARLIGPLAIQTPSGTYTYVPGTDSIDIVAGDEIKNFDQIMLGDMVVARYVEALTLDLKKTKVAAGGVVVREDAAKAKAGERPAVAGGRQITASVEVTAVYPNASTITVKGPRGTVVALNVRNPDQFKVVKVGDQVEVTYTEAVALSVEPAPKKP